jgi:hypothetical protein
LLDPALKARIGFETIVECSIFLASELLILSDAGLPPKDAPGWK